MTAEIAVLNRTAVALAADSASTSLQATGLPKIFNTADKLFHLDGVSPIGIMVYGSAAFMGVPWETIIKRYRSNRVSKCATVQEAAEKFLSFLGSPELFSDDHLRQWLELHIRELANEAQRAVTLEKQRTGNALSTGMVCADILSKIVSGWPLLPGMTVASIDSFIAERNGVLDASIDLAFASELPDPAARQHIKQIIARAVLTVPRIDDGAASGVVLAGFGEDELFPALWNCLVRSVLASRQLQQNPPESEPLKLPMAAMIRPFAQAEMVYSFMQGIDPNLRQMIENGVSNLIAKFSEHLTNATGFSDPTLSAFKAAISNTAASLNQNFRAELELYCRSRHVEPVIGAVGLLPKDQLAVMAETLVSLTSFKRKMSRDAETVGGDVDVAVISKGDGFIWVKRKHYFPLELNLRYTERIKQTS